MTVRWFGDDEGDLPWGWWLRSNGGMLEDQEGRRWPTVRKAFWVGQLGFPDEHVAREQLELLLRVLVTLDRRYRDGRETIHDIFAGDMIFWRFYMGWLRSLGLLALDTGALDGPLSNRGRSVLRMLQATRDPDWAPLPFAAIAASVARGEETTADAAREKALAEFERQARNLPYVFAREAVHSTFVVTLTGVGTGAKMPVRRVMWSQSFPDRRARDDFFAWLADRVERWEDWGKLAYWKGASDLTQHLFALVAIR